MHPSCTFSTPEYAAKSWIHPAASYLQPRELCGIDIYPQRKLLKDLKLIFKVLPCFHNHTCILLIAWYLGLLKLSQFLFLPGLWGLRHGPEAFAIFQFLSTYLPSDHFWTNIQVWCGEPPCFWSWGETEMGLPLVPYSHYVQLPFCSVLIVSQGCQECGLQLVHLIVLPDFQNATPYFSF